MLKKSLLAGISLICLNPIQATQTTTPQNPPHHEPVQHSTTQHEPARHELTQHSTKQHEPVRHEPTQHSTTQHEPVRHEPTQHSTTQHEPAHPVKDTKHCPCDGTGGKRAWVLIEAGEGCNKEEATEPHHKPEPHHNPEPHHTPTEDHHITPHKPSLHPLPTKEEEELAEKLNKDGKAHIFRRADPNNPNVPKEEQRGESGKELDGKVYFQHLGIWKHDPSVHPTKDIISTSVRERARRLNEEAKRQQEGEKPASTEASKHHQVNVPDALGTTEGRVQSVRTEGKEREFGVGAPNRAQTGVTGQAIPRADTSETRAAVPPPPHAKAELSQ